MKLEEIMGEMERRVVANEPISASSWCESALRVNQLLSEKDNQLACYEAELINHEAELLEEDMTSAKAKIIAKTRIDYKKYLELKAELARIGEFIKLAKRRASINEY